MEGMGEWGTKNLGGGREKKALPLSPTLSPPQVVRKLLLFPRKWGKNSDIIVPQIIGRYWLTFPPSNMLQRQPGISQIMIIKSSSCLYFSKLRSSPPPPSPLHILSLNLMKDFLPSFHCHHHFLTPPLEPTQFTSYPYHPFLHHHLRCRKSFIYGDREFNNILVFHECFENSILEQRKKKSTCIIFGGLLYEIDPKKRRAKVALAQKVLSALHHPSVSHILNQPSTQGRKKERKKFSLTHHRQYILGLPYLDLTCFTEK